MKNKKTEKAPVEHTKSEYEAMLKSIGDGLVVVDKEGKITYTNIASEEMLGWKFHEIIGKKMDKVIQAEDVDGTKIEYKDRIMTQVLLGRKFVVDQTNQIYYVRKNNTRFPISSVVSPVLLDSKIVGAVAVFRDITKEREIDKAKTEFVSLASHQLRTPLSAVRWYSEMLLAGDAGEVSPEQKKYIEEIYRGNQRMIGLVNALLDVSRIEMGTFIMESKPVDVVKLAQDVIDDNKLHISEKRISFSGVFQKKILNIQSDPKVLHIVLQNILSNAIKYTPEGGKVELSIFHEESDKNNLKGGNSRVKNKDNITEKYIIIKILDSGYGIPKDQQSKIFTKLFRANNVVGKDTQGTGLGLYIAKSIVDQSGGNIWFESNENKGTVFYVRLPIRNNTHRVTY